MTGAFVFLFLLGFDLFVLPGFRPAPQTITKAIVEGYCKDTEGAAGLGVIDGTKVVFTLLHAPTGNGAVGVFLNGIYQREGADYTLAAKLLTMRLAPPVGSSLEAWYRAEFNQ